jgi:uncharacterized protein YbaP (TraB family)
MQKFILTLALLALIAATDIQAQLLWKISGDGIQTSYLFGTHHLIQKGQIPDFDRTLTFIKEVDAVVGEMDMNNKMSMQLKLMNAALMKDTTLTDLLSAEDYALVNKAFEELAGLNLKVMNKMKPTMLSTMYVMLLYMKQNNITKEPEAVDETIQKAGRDAKKQIIGLETVEQQINILFNSTPLKRQAELLVESVKDKEKSILTIREMNEAYLNGNLQKLQELYLANDDMNEEEQHLLVDNRNANWVNQLTELLKNKSCFVAVGALHLAGNSGLIQQLRLKGFKVEAID